MVLMAAQTEISEDYGNGKITVTEAGVATTSNTAINDEVSKLAEAKAGWSYQIKFAKDGNNAIAVTDMSFSDGTYKFLTRALISSVRRLRARLVIRSAVHKLRRLLLPPAPVNNKC